MIHNNVLAIILAGGKGSRLDPLTRDRAKPAVPFGGAYRIVDFTLSNCYNSGLRKILLLTQYKAMSLDRHISIGWARYFCREMREYADVVPPQQYVDENWYLGTADAVYQNIFALEEENPEYVIVLAGDHIYKMNYAKMLEFHIANDAHATVAAIPVHLDTARGQFGVMEVDQTFRIRGFEEKPQEPKPLPDDPAKCLASMGIYIFNARFLYHELLRDAAEPGSKHDFGTNIIPSLIDQHKVYAFAFMDENRKTEAYWRDVGTLDAYYETNMDLVSVDPQLNLYDGHWPIYTFHPNLPPPKFVFDNYDRRGAATDSVICPGCIISGGTVTKSILGHRCRVNSYSQVRYSILCGNTDVGRGAKVRNAIIDKDVRIPPDVMIGYDAELDRRRGFTITENGVTVVPKLAGPDNFIVQ